jgi:hypothetical protein
MINQRPSQVVAVNHQGQTGPKTLLGKQSSAKNARKSEIFVRGYLDWEDIEQKQALHDRLLEQWGADDPTSQIFIATIEQANLECERLMSAQKLKVEGAMMQLNIAQEFAQHASLDVLGAHLLPSWYFSDDDDGQKKWAIWVDQVWLQASKLQRSYHDSLVPRIAQDYPQLFEYVMKGQSANASFLSVLGLRYKQTTPSLNLASLMNEIREKYPHHLQWAADPRSYQIIIDALRADLALQALDLDKSSRYMTSIQNRLLKATQALIHLKQIQASDANRVIELEAPKSKKLGKLHQHQDKDEEKDDGAIAA